MKNKQKKLPLKKSLKDKRRYFLVKASNENIKDAILEYVGILGMAKSAYNEVKEEKIKDYTIGSCLTKSLEDIRASLAFKKIKIEKVSGTIKGLSK